MGQDDRLRKCLTTTKTHMVMRELHEGPLGGHLATEITQKKILNVGYWWPTMYKDVNDYCICCDACQKIRGLATLSLAKLFMNIPKEPFMK